MCSKKSFTHVFSCFVIKTDAYLTSVLFQGKRKSTSEADEEIPASKRVKPGNPTVKALATHTRRAARKSVNNALRISRKAAAGKPQNPGRHSVILFHLGHTNLCSS